MHPRWLASEAPIPADLAGLMHLGLLHRERVVGRSKDRTRVMYRIVDPSVVRLCEGVCGAIEQQHGRAHEASVRRQPAVLAADPHEEESR